MRGSNCADGTCKKREEVVQALQLFGGESRQISEGHHGGGAYNSAV